LVVQHKKLKLELYNLEKATKKIWQNLGPDFSGEEGLEQGSRFKEKEIQG